jgi:hypothetical protein
MSAKNITVDYVTELHARIKRGETPQKIDKLSPKEFIRQMLPHVKSFLTQGYTYKEIADFFGHISSGDLKKAVAKENPAPTEKKQSKAGQTAKTVSARIPCKNCKGRKAPQPGA